MRPATMYYLAQASSPHANRQFQRDDAPPCDARVPRRYHPGRGLSAVTRRVLAVLDGTS